MRQSLDPGGAADDDGTSGRRGVGADDAANPSQIPEVVTVVSQHGRPDDGSDASPFSNVELFVPLKPSSNGRKG